VPDAYRLVDSGTDALGRPWSVSVCGATVLVHTDPRFAGITLSPAIREQFTRAWIEAERIAEGCTVVANYEPLEAA